MLRASFLCISLWYTKDTAGDCNCSLTLAVIQRWRTTKAKYLFTCSGLLSIFFSLSPPAWGSGQTMYRNSAFPWSSFIRYSLGKSKEAGRMGNFRTLVFWPDFERWLICGESRDEGRKGGNQGWGLRVEDPGLRWRGALHRNHRPCADINAGTNHSNYNPYSTTSHPFSKPST